MKWGHILPPQELQELPNMREESSEPAGRKSACNNPIGGAIRSKSR
jgi:hypothetical protein